MVINVQSQNIKIRSVTRSKVNSDRCLFSAQQTQNGKAPSQFSHRYCNRNAVFAKSDFSFSWHSHSNLGVGEWVDQLLFHVAWTAVFGRHSHADVIHMNNFNAKGLITTNRQRNDLWIWRRLRFSLALGVSTRLPL